jgi:hypothetical protein
LKKIAFLAQLCIILATVVLVVQAWLVGQRLEALLTFGVGIVWVLGSLQSLAWMDSLMLVLYTLLVIYSIFMDRSVLPGFFVIVSALAAWNFSYLNRRLEYTSNPGIRQQLISNHIRRSGILIVIAAVLAILSYFLKMELNLGIAILIGALGIIGLSQLVGYLLKQKE